MTQYSTVAVQFHQLVVHSANTEYSLRSSLYSLVVHCSWRQLYIQYCHCHWTLAPGVAVAKNYVKYCRCTMLLLQYMNHFEYDCDRWHNLEWSPACCNGQEVLAIHPFSVAGPAVWNSLPDHLHDPAVNFEQFRPELKTYLFTRRSKC